MLKILDWKYFLEIIFWKLRFEARDINMINTGKKEEIGVFYERFHTSFCYKNIESN